MRFLSRTDIPAFGNRPAPRGTGNKVKGNKVKGNKEGQFRRM